MILFIYKYIIPIYSVIMLGVLVYAITHGLIRLWRVKSRFFSVERVFVYGLIFGIVLNIAFWAPAFFFPELMMWWATSPFAFISILVPGQFLTTFAAALWSQAYIEVGVMPKWILYGGYYAPLVTGMIYAGIFSLIARAKSRGERP